MILKAYQDRKNRDAEAKRLRAEGYQVTVHASRNQLLHPMYVEELKDGLSAADRGFGNTIYQTHFAILYHLEARI